MPPREKSLHEYILAYMQAHHGVPPSSNDIQTVFGYSKSLIHHYLGNLETRGLIAFQPDLPTRNIIIPGATWTPPTP